MNEDDRRDSGPAGRLRSSVYRTFSFCRNFKYLSADPGYFRTYPDQCQPVLDKYKATANVLSDEEAILIRDVVLSISTSLADEDFVDAIHSESSATSLIALVDRHGRTFLHHAARADHLEAAKLILRFDVDRDAEDVKGNTALHYACVEGHSDVVGLLLENGCLIDCRNLDGDSPLHLAAANIHYRVIHLLLRAGSGSRHRTNEKGHTPLLSFCLTRRKDTGFRASSILTDFLANNILYADLRYLSRYEALTIALLSGNCDQLAYLLDKDVAVISKTWMVSEIAVNPEMSFVIPEIPLYGA